MRRSNADGTPVAEAQASSEQSVLAGVSSKMPALMEAYKLSSRAAHVGFDWPEMEGLFAKLEEETVELREELKAVPELHSKGQSSKANRWKRGLPGRESRRFRPNCASASKMKWETCSSSW